MKKTAWAPVNLALIKYWGRINDKLRLPANSSLSVNLSNLFTITTVEFSPAYKRDEVIIDGEKKEKAVERVRQHLDLIRKLSGKNFFAKVISQNNFPKGTGIASSASGFAALTLAATKALNLNLSEKELSIIARLGSGSASRSIPDGFVEWKKGDKSEDSFSYSVFSQNHWPQLRIATLILETKEKKVSSTEGHRLAPTSPFFNRRIKLIDKKIKQLKESIKKRNFQLFGSIIEQEALEMHAIMLTSQSPLMYWSTATLDLMKRVWHLRQSGVKIYFTLDAGPNLHLFYLENESENVVKRLKHRKINRIVINKIARGARLVNNQLF
jgi:diphosphomevalonate decarboxylase